MAEVCTDCWRWKTFKEGCWFYWRGKKECSKFINHPADEERIKREESSIYF